MIIGAGCALGAFICGVAFGDKIKGAFQVKLDAIKAKFKTLV